MARAAPIPVPRNQHSSAILNGKIYVVGGQFHHDSEQIDQARIDIYDPETDTQRDLVFSVMVTVKTGLRPAHISHNEVWEIR